MYLPISGDAGTDREQQPLVLPVLLQFRRSNHAWPHQAHLSSQHIKELWKLVKTEFSQHNAKPRHSWIALQFEILVKCATQLFVADEQMVGIAPHRAELERIEFSARPHASPSKDDRCAFEY